jgi:hypothetical protein
MNKQKKHLPAEKSGEKDAASELTALEKDGEIIHVCEAQVEQHKRLGWKAIVRGE